MIPALTDEWARQTIAVIKTECLYPWLLVMNSRALACPPALLVRLRGEEHATADDQRYEGVLLQRGQMFETRNEGKEAMSVYCVRRAWLVRLWERKMIDYYHPKLVGALEDVTRCSRKFQIVDGFKDELGVRIQDQIARLTEWIHTERTKRERKAAQRRRYEELKKKVKQAQEAKAMGTSK